jgi:hypothetical protein
LNIPSELRVLEEKLLQPSFRRNRKEIAELLAEDFYEFGSSGRVWNKQQILDHLETGPIFNVTIRDFQAKQLAPGAILVTYNLTIQTPQTETTHSLRSSIWISHEDRWQILFHQGTPTNR